MLQTLKSIRQNGSELHHMKFAAVPEGVSVKISPSRADIPFVHFEKGEFESKLPYDFDIEVAKDEESMVCLAVSLSFVA